MSATATKEKPKVNPEFKNLLPALSDQERANLKGKILIEGFRDPIVVWEQKNVIIEGHHRTEIGDEIRRNKGGTVVGKDEKPLRIEYEPAKHDPKYTYLPFDTDEEVQAWIITNQDSRRNWTELQRKYFLGKKYQLLKGKRGGEQEGRENVAEKLAAKEGVTSKTVENAAKFADAVDKIGENNPEARGAILTNANTSIQDVVRIARQDARAVAKAAEKIAGGKSVDEVAENIPDPPKGEKKPGRVIVIKDKFGKVVPGHLKRVFDAEARDDFDIVSNLAVQFAREVGALAERNCGAKLRKVVDDLQSKARSMSAEVKAKAPHSVCDKCQGTNTAADEEGNKKEQMESCKRCGGDGFLSKEVAEIKA